MLSNVNLSQLPVNIFYSKEVYYDKKTLLQRF